VGQGIPTGLLCLQTCETVHCTFAHAFSKCNTQQFHFVLGCVCMCVLAICQYILAACKFHVARGSPKSREGREGREGRERLARRENRKWQISAETLMQKVNGRKVVNVTKNDGQNQFLQFPDFLSRRAKRSYALPPREIGSASTCPRNAPHLDLPGTPCECAGGQAL
jgi:hypothetical protein